MLICLFGVIFVIVTLPGAMRQSKREGSGRDPFPLPEEPRAQESAYWKKDVSFSHPQHEFEYLEAVQRSEESPHHYPQPLLPPSMRGQGA